MDENNVITQIFNPPLRLCDKNCNDFADVKKRKWCAASENGSANQNFDKIAYIGSRQIEEVWKHYWKEYYISNYGYIVKIKPEDESLISEDLKNADENSAGVRWLDFKEELKKIFRERAFVPLNRVNSGCQICLNITGNSAEYDIHRLVARFFLKKPIDFEEKKYVVHHIDNNSYNNSVTNVVYLSADSHFGGQHKIYHPMSYK